MRVNRCRVLFLTFGDGSAEFRAASIRLANQAWATGLFAMSVSVSESGLVSVSQDFDDIRPSLQLLDIPPLYYRAVKPWILKAALDGAFGEFHCVMYADAGCELSNFHVARRSLKKRLELACLQGSFAEQTRLIEANWTKKKTLDELKVDFNEASDFQFQDTWFVMRNDLVSRAFAESWISLSLPEKRLWQNPINDEEAGPDLIEHRHDQSLFSILFRRLGGPYTPVAMDFEISAFLGRLRCHSVPVMTIRNRTGLPKSKPLNMLDAVLMLFISPLSKLVVWLVSSLWTRRFPKGRLRGET